MKAALVVALCVASAAARADAPLPDKTERVIGLARVWERVKVQHPWLYARGTIDWDRALLDAIPKAEAAKTVADYRAAVAQMIGALADPATRMIDPPPAAPPAAPTPHAAVTTPAKGIVAIDMTALITGAPADTQAAKTALASATIAIVDLRSPIAGAVGYAFEPLVEQLPAIAAWPEQREIEHHGFRTQEGRTSGGYFTTFVTRGGRPPKAAPASGPKLVIALADEHTAIPPAIVALERSGAARILASAPLAEADQVTTTVVEAAAGVSVEARIGELLGPKVAADELVPQGTDLGLRALGLAKSLLSARLPKRATPILSPGGARIVDDDDYPTAAYPSRELRLLAGIRAWTILDTYWPYRGYATGWDGALREVLPLLEAAPDAIAYRDALSRLGAIAADGHIGVYPIKPDVQPRRGGALPVLARMIEGKLAVVQILDAAGANGIKVGDAIDAIDGAPVAALLAKQLRLTAGSTDDARQQSAALAIQLGRDGTTVKLSIAGREVSVQRTAASRAAIWAPSKAPHWELRANGAVGYVDLRLLVPGEVDAMFAALAKTKAIVFDMRGYPNGTAWSIAPHINTKHAKVGAEFWQPLVNSEDDYPGTRIRFLQPLNELPPGAALYAGKVAVLIDDRAISQAEHTCLFFEAAAGATFIGSPTAGTNGDVTVMRLPGGLRMSFTGQEPRHADGRQLQRTGIQPTIAVRPTIAGLRAGKDEVLERAMSWAQSGK